MNNMLEYMGYHAKVEFEADDGLLVGEVFGINDSLNFHGSTVEELTEMFHQSIDNYLSMCKDLGQEPDKEFKGSFNVRVSPDTHRKASFEASKRGVTLNQFVAEAVENFLVPQPETERYVYFLPIQTEKATWSVDTSMTFDSFAYCASGFKKSFNSEVSTVG